MVVAPSAVVAEGELEVISACDGVGGVGVAEGATLAEGGAGMALSFVCKRTQRAKLADCLRDA